MRPQVCLCVCGGVCNDRCTAMLCMRARALNSTHKYVEAKDHFEEIGIKTGGVSMDFGKLMGSKDKAVTGLTSGIEHLFKKNKVDYMKGWGKFEGANQIGVDLNSGSSESITAKNIIIATKGGLFSERADAFVISSNRQT